MPYFTIILPTFNRHEKTRNAIESVLSQTYRDFELVVVDDGSTDATPRLQEEFSRRITYIRQDNGGVSAARNRGLRQAQSPYLAFIDSDDLWLPHKLEEHKNFIVANPTIRIHQSEETWIRKGRRVNPRTKHLKKDGHIFIPSLDLCLISPSAVVMHHGLFDDYGFFDENLPACEDYDLWLRITAHEEVGLIKKELMVRYGGHEDQLSQKYWGMDRFRIYAIIKILAQCDHTLPLEYQLAAKDKALEKLHILLAGSKKRERSELIEILADMIEKVRNEDYNKIDYPILLTI
ncbi:MAG: glycosyl transferase [Spirochaetae bacterium HGW-Spirochaetae-1]|jgi:glycosyltransferase involved in cell wall biosynthesis|nr:MAG: glycosyl transferase [Spirochaetae bacterium HGW-Spirochaetae-1]